MTLFHEILKKFLVVGPIPEMFASFKGSCDGRIIIKSLKKKRKKKKIPAVQIQ